MILPSEVSPGSSEEEVQVLKEVTPRPATPNDSSKKVKPIKEQILNLTNKEEKVILQAAKQIRKKKVAEQNKALAATLIKSYEREKKEKVLDTRQLNFMFKHSTVKLTKIFDNFSGVNIKKKDLGLKQHATNLEISQPTISLNNVMLLKIAFIYFLFSSLLYPYPILFQALNKGMQLRQLRNSYKSPHVYGENHPTKRAKTSNFNNNNVLCVPATFALYA